MQLGLEVRLRDLQLLLREHDPLGDHREQEHYKKQDDGTFKRILQTYTWAQRNVYH